MELKYLATVRKIIETGSYQKAAAALNYAQSTITFQVGRWNRNLGRGCSSAAAAPWC